MTYESDIYPDEDDQGPWHRHDECMAEREAEIAAAEKQGRQEALAEALGLAAGLNAAGGDLDALLRAAEAKARQEGYNEGYLLGVSRGRQGALNLMVEARLRASQATDGHVDLTRAFARVERRLAQQLETEVPMEAAREQAQKKEA